MTHNKEHVIIHKAKAAVAWEAGKPLSIEHWEQTCDYYVTHFPYETYGLKWKARKGRAIHTASDFGRSLLPWGPALFAASTKIN